INLLKERDIRNDLEKYIYRPAIQQQYSLNLSGGGKTNLYYISAGYNKDLKNTATDSYDRFTLNANNTYHLLNNQLQVSTGILLAASSTNSSNSTYTNPFVPHEQLIDAEGNHSSVLRGS